MIKKIIKYMMVGMLVEVTLGCITGVVIGLIIIWVRNPVKTVEVVRKTIEVIP